MPDLPAADRGACQVAYVDESESRQDLDPGAYILCASIMATTNARLVARKMRGLLAPGRVKVHWHDAKTRGERGRIVQVVAGLPASHLVVAGVFGSGVRVERRRRLCMERLLAELELRSVRMVVAESRGPGDRLDRLLVDTLRAKGAVGSAVRVEHAPGPTEPLLWVADTVCGAVVQDRCGDGTYLRELGGAVQVILI